MRVKAIAGSTLAVALLGLGVLVGSMLGTGSTSAQTSGSGNNPQTTAPQSTSPQATAPQSTAPQSTLPQTAPSTKITQQQAEQTALAASPGNTVDHTALVNDQNGNAVWDVDFTNGGGATVDAQTGKIITSEAAGKDMGGRGGHMGGANQAALAAKATVTKDQAEKTALAAAPGSTVDHSRLGGDVNGTIFWDVDFSNGGGATVNAQTGAIIANEAAGTDHGGRPGNGAPPANQP